MGSTSYGVEMIYIIFLILTVVLMIVGFWMTIQMNYEDYDTVTLGDVLSAFVNAIFSWAILLAAIASLIGEYTRRPRILRKRIY